MHSQLAKLAYRLACLGPVAFLIMGIADPLLHPFAWPVSIWQSLWWLFCLCSPVGMLLGMLAHVQIRRCDYPLIGANHALAGIVVGGLASVALVFGTGSLLDTANSLIRGPARTTVCMSNIKQLNIGMLMYTQDYDEQFPSPYMWNEGIMPYVKNDQIFHCPEEPVQDVPSYGMNGRLKKLKVSTLASLERTVLLFDSIPGKDIAGGKALLPRPPRHDNGQNVGFVDGHAKWIPENQIDSLLWKPSIQKHK
jgi:prepilin-type processing-associated H-X9-DG protein